MTLRWWPVVVVAGAILVFSLVPLGGGGAVSSAAGDSVVGIGIDKILHIVDYAALAVTLLYATRARTARACFVAFAVAVTFGGAIELLQIPVPTRQGSLLDATANALGAAIATLVWWRLSSKHPVQR